MRYSCLLSNSVGDFISSAEIHMEDSEGFVYFATEVPPTLKPMSRVKVEVASLNQTYFGFVIKVDNDYSMLVMTLTRLDEDERRSGLRVDMGEHIEVIIVSKDGVHRNKVFLLDLSDGGMAFLSDKVLSLDTEVAYTFNKVLYPFTLGGKVVRAGSSEGSNVYAVRFSKQDELNHAVLVDYLTNRVNKSNLAGVR